jgi:phospholipase/carboxylesterase
VSLDELPYRARDPGGDPEGVLVLMHGRGADEDDLAPLFDILDPRRRLLCLSPRGPLSLPPGGAHWYVVREVGHPDPGTFHPTFERLQRWFDAVLEDARMAPEQAVLGGFSQGCVMAYALGLAAGLPQPGAITAFSGFLPTVEGLELDLSERPSLRVAIGHGIYDPVIGVEWGRGARARFESAGAEVLYQESPMPHSIDPGFAARVGEWLGPPGASAL